MKDLFSGKESTLSNKFCILLMTSLARNAEEFKPGGKPNSPYEIPDRDVPIVHALLKSAGSPNPPEKDLLISDWLTPTGIPSTDYDRIHDLHSAVEEILTDLEQNDEIDDVTHNEWMRAIDISIGFDKAIAMLNRIKELELLMKWATILDVPGNNEVVINGEDGTRQYLHNPTVFLYDVTERPISQIAEECNSLDEFSFLLQSVYLNIQSIIAKKAKYILCRTAACSRMPGVEHITDAFATSEQIASEYYAFKTYNQWYEIVRSTYLCGLFRSTIKKR